MFPQILSLLAFRTVADTKIPPALPMNTAFVEDATPVLSAEEHIHTVTKIFPRVGLARKTEDVLLGLAE